MKMTRHNGRAGKNGVYNPKHNDRQFDLTNADHIDAARERQNIYWDCFQGFRTGMDDGQAHDSFEDVERQFYSIFYRESVEAQNERNIQNRHPERNRSTDDLLHDKRTCPEESILQIGNIDESVDGETLVKIACAFFTEMEERFGEQKAIYKDNADTIVGNCDTTLFLGGKEKTTLKEISEILGKETIDSFNTSETRGRELSHGLNYQKLGKELMTQDEIAVMDGGKCILQLRGVRPFFSDKYDITKHPKYKYLSDADPKNAFDMEKHIKRRPAIVKPDEVFDYYEIDVQEDAAP